MCAVLGCMRVPSLAESQILAWAGCLAGIRRTGESQRNGSRVGGMQIRSHSAEGIKEGFKFYQAKVLISHNQAQSICVFRL